MKKRLMILVFTFAATAAVVSAQTSWLDRPLNRNWNNGNGVVPNAPRTFAPIDTRCREQIRTPESLADRAVTRAGWSLFGSSQSYGRVSVVMAMAGVDGMCRPNQYNAFVFVSNRFAGTLAPEPVDSRTDGAFGRLQLFNEGSLSAEFTRYTSSDALCCPSQTSNVNYSISSGNRSVLKAETVNTSANCDNTGGQTQDNVVSGTVTYRQRSALPSTAVLSVRLLDVSRADAAADIIAEDRIDLAGKQVPISFDIAYDRSR
ncbi:MAG: YbaY family lipoprotein, partial [Pyrinomonadaceae bacterium]